MLYLIVPSNDNDILYEINGEKTSKVLNDPDYNNNNNINTNPYLSECTLISVKDNSDSNTWSCPACTFINRNEISQCVMCGSTCPADHSVNTSIPLVRGLLVTETSEIGTTRRLIGKTGIYIKLNENVHEVINLSLETGLYNIIQMDFVHIKVHDKWAGYDLTDISEIYGLLLQYNHTLFIHHIRVFLLMVLLMSSSSSSSNSASSNEEDINNILPINNPNDAVNYFLLLISSENLYESNIHRNCLQGRLLLVINKILYVVMNRSINGKPLLDVYILLLHQIILFLFYLIGIY